MDLSEYLYTKGLTQAAFVDLLNRNRPAGVSRVYPDAMSEYVTGKRPPAVKLQRRIRDLTGGLVDGNSWLDQEVL